MIFSIGNHIELIQLGYKTQTRRPSGKYQLGKTYAIQPGRGKKGIPEGRICIINKWEESWNQLVTGEEANAEGRYTVREYEDLYEKMYPSWEWRWAYEFMFVQTLHRKANENDN